MALYLYQAAYTAEAWEALLSKPQDPRERVQALLDKLGGKIIGIWYAFGDYDIMAIVEYPGNQQSASAAMAMAAGKALKAAKTTPLMTIEEGVAAMKEAADAVGLYRPPGH